MASKTVTASSGWSRMVACTKLAPMKPAPPVTSSRMEETLARPSARRYQTQCSGHLFKCAHQLAVGPAQHLDRHVIGAGLKMLVEARGDLLGRAVGDDSVNQLVAAGFTDIGIGEPEPPPVVHVVTQPEVEVGGFPADFTRLVGVGGQHHLVF